jgi:hypothetical protein
LATIEKTSPATMSARAAPPWIALRMSLLMKAEQCSPNFRGAAACRATSPMSSARSTRRSPAADSSRNEPVPAEQASFIA